MTADWTCAATRKGQLGTAAAAVDHAAGAGSVGFRRLASLMERDYTLGLETGVAVISAVVALRAGQLFGRVLVPPRRYL